MKSAYEYILTYLKHLKTPNDFTALDEGW
jgi:hypothetical protein